MTVQHILDTQHARKTTHIAPGATIAHVLQSPEFETDGALVVSTNGSTVEGIISERDIARGLRETGPELLNRPVRDLMTAKVWPTPACLPMARYSWVRMPTA